MPTTADLLPMVLLGTLLGSMAYGVFLVLVFKSVTLLLSSQANKSAKTHKITLCIILAQLVIVTAHWILSISRCFDAFIYAGDLPTGSVLYYATISHPKYVTYTGLYVLQAIITDLFMVYRMYIIWSKKIWICIVPGISVITLIVAGTGVCITFSRLMVGENVYVSVAQPYIISSLAANLFTNVFCSIMITGQIWRSQRAFKIGNNFPRRSSRVTRTMHIVIDSAALFTVVTLSAFVAYVLQSNFHFTCVDVATPVIGISFCLIIVRVGGRVDQAESTQSKTWVHRTTGGVETAHNASDNQDATQQSGYPIVFPTSSMSVQIVREVHQEIGSDYDKTRTSQDLV